MHDRALCPIGGTLQKITCRLERFKSTFLQHHVVLGADCNVSLDGFENARFVGDATVTLTKARSCADAEKNGCELLLGFAQTTCGLSGIA